LSACAPVPDRLPPAKGIELELAEKLVRRLGGAGNLAQLEPCQSRIRVQVRDPELVDVPGLKAMGAYGVVISGWVVQVVIGGDAETLVADMRRLTASRLAAA
jgi:PTS system N-acetylglucosamine-specific IIB component